MFLKSLSLKGFKSFADATLLEMEPGVTVVVGPNGSGKSNVVDAIAWVLGAQAPSSVRSQKMDDVIFAGTSKRPALGRAEVSLTIDNSSRMLPIEFEEVTITRTLFRDGDSEYSLNGVPCRLLDVQELLSDTGVGRQQHVIVSQGQIDGVLNARPEERRAIIEEAAGVLKFRRRREKAERRLSGTEENLTRVRDLLREVRRQVRPLERQADAARRHGDLLSELSTLQIHLAGREIDSLRGRHQLTRATRSELDQRETALKAQLRTGDEEVAVAEARLSATGAHDVGDRLARAEGLRERARGLHALLSERMAGFARQLESSVDQGVVESLEAETVRLQEELAQVEDAVEALGPDTERVREAEHSLAEQRSLFEHEQSHISTAAVGEAAELRGRLAALATTVQASDSTERHLSVRLPELAAAQTKLLSTEHDLQGRLATLDAESEALEISRNLHLTLVAGAEAAVVQAEQQVHESEADRRAWTARADALSLALEEARAASGAESLSEVDGVLGTLLELIDIDEGWEAAFEAAAANAVAAVVVRDVTAARKALTALRAEDASGAILAIAGLSAHADPTNAPPGELRGHIRSANAGVERLLDRLIGHVAVVADWSAGVEAALAQPAATFVSRQGDRFASDGWRVGVRGSGATGAALEEALQGAERSIAELDHRRRTRDQAEVSQRDALSKRDQLAARAVEVARLRELGRDSLSRAQSDLRAARVESDAVETQLAEVGQLLAVDRGRQADLLAALPLLEADEQTALDRDHRLDQARERLERDLADVGAQRTDIQVRRGAIDERRQFLRARLTEVDGRLDGYAAQRAEASERRRGLEGRLAMSAMLRGIVERRSAQVEAELAELRAQRQAQSDEAKAAALRLDELRRTRTAAERELTVLREHATRAELEDGEISLKLEAVTEALRRDHVCEPGRAVATECPTLQGGTAPERARELERELRIMGPINPLALEEFEALQERQQFLSDQLDDVRASRRELNKVIRAIDDEIVNVFSAAFADVSANFETLFSALFPGGVGRLRLTTPDDLLNTGIEIEAKPSGKNVKKLSLLSGGERSLTALGFLFAVFRSRPSPFYVMDEVEAALDDVNLHRFLQLVQEFRNEAQLIIVSHQKRTMEAADCLYGVTMAPGGSSKIVSERPGSDIDLTNSPTQHAATQAGSPHPEHERV